MSAFTHLNAEGRPRMVDVSEKPTTRRQAIARSAVRMSPEAFGAIRDGSVMKGDVLATAQIAGISAAKRTSEWIPLCHTLPITGADLHFRFNEALRQVEIEARVQACGPTGVEMEALTAASAAALTIYDMVKALDPAMVIGQTWLVSKEGGRRGTFRHFRAQVVRMADSSGAVGVLQLERGAQLQLMPLTGEPNPDPSAVWLNASELEALTPGNCLEAGPLRIEVLYARASGWLAEVNDPGVLRAGDLIEMAN
jgi:cyclic pyranopterin phosphate synthase